MLQSHVISSDGPVSQLHVTAQFYLESKGKHILKCKGGPTQKTSGEEKSLAQFWLLSLSLSVCV